MDELVAVRPHRTRDWQHGPTALRVGDGQCSQETLTVSPLCGLQGSRALAEDRHKSILSGSTAVNRC